MRREGDKIIFDSIEQKQELMNRIDIGDDDFAVMMMRILAKARRDRGRACRFIVDELKAQNQIADDETISLDYTISEFKIVKLDRKVNLGE